MAMRRRKVETPKVKFRKHREKAFFRKAFLSIVGIWLENDSLNSILHLFIFSRKLKKVLCGWIWGPVVCPWSNSLSGYLVGLLHSFNLSGRRLWGCHPRGKEIPQG